MEMIDLQMLVINADDFGACSRINRAIVKCFQLSLVNSTSLLANYEAFDEAIEMAKKNDFMDKIGIHINLSSEKPLTNFGSSQIVNSDGTFREQFFTYKRLVLDKKSKQLIRNEICAQIEKVLKAGIKPTHMNSHHHLHTRPCLFPLFIEIAKEYKLKIRIAQSHNDGHWLKTWYNRLINYIIKYNDLQYTEYFDKLKYIQNHSTELCNGTYEIMVHPIIEKGELILDHVEKNNLEEEINKARMVHQSKTHTIRRQPALKTGTIFLS